MGANYPNSTISGLPSVIHPAHVHHQNEIVKWTKSNFLDIPATKMWRGQMRCEIVYY